MNTLLSRLGSSINHFSNDFFAGMRDFSDMPLQYISRAVADYYDTAGAIAAPYAFFDINNTLGDFRWPICFIGSASALFGPAIAARAEGDNRANWSNRESNRLFRNLALFTSSACYNIPPARTGHSLHPLFQKVNGYLLTLTALLLEYQRTDLKNEKREKK